MLRWTTFFLVTLTLFGCVSLPSTNQHIIDKPRNAIRFATYNVYWQNNSKQKHNPNSITFIINQIKPDIIVLQETHCFSVGKLEKYFRKTHPYQLFRNDGHNGHEDGLGILSRYPIVKNIYFPPVYGWFPGWLYVIKTPRGYVQVLNVHLNPKLVSDNNIGIFAEGLWATPKFRLLEISYYHKYLDPKLPIIVAGDFNENDDGAACVFLRNHFFKDVLSCIPHYIKTWISHFGPFTFTGRYDRIYISQNVHPLRCQVLRKGYSDHYPVIMDYTTSPTARCHPERSVRDPSLRSG